MSNSIHLQGATNFDSEFICCNISTLILDHLTSEIYYYAVV